MNRPKNMQISANLVRSFLQSCSVYAGALPRCYADSKPRLWALAFADPTIRKNLLHMNWDDPKSLPIAPHETPTDLKAYIV
jgi:hypothetical protein